MSSPGLPAYDTPFVGRASELTQLTRRLAKVRLVTVTGPGGVGKTRLALHAAGTLRSTETPRSAETRGSADTLGSAERFRDGVCLAPLSSVTDPALVPREVATRLGLPERSGGTAHDAVLDYLRDRRLLLILDTCEHLLDACAGFTESLLLAAEDLTVLATSRQPLDVTGEHVFPIGPLPVPPDGERPCAGDATDLFTRLATSAAPGFVPDEGAQRDVIRLCRRLDGIPLALELAAARLRTTPLADLADAPLTDSPSGPRKTGPRHESLEKAIAWSYDLCGPAEQALWQRFTVFADTVGITAVEEVCSGDGLARDAILPTLIGLVEKSVIRREPTDGPARFRMLDTIREFGARRLADSGTSGAVKRRLVGHYLNRVRYFDDHLIDEEQFGVYDELRRERASLHAALSCASPGGRPPGPPDARPIASDLIGRAAPLDGASPGRRSPNARPIASDLIGHAALSPALDSQEDPFGRDKDLEFLGGQLAIAGFWYWVAAGVPREGLRWLDRALRVFDGPGPERSRALAARCLLGSLAGEGPRAVADGREGVALADESGDRQAGARGQLFGVLALAVTQEYQAALAAGPEAERRLTALDDHPGLCIHALFMLVVHALAENFTEADEWYQRGVAMLGQSGERVLSGWLHLLGGYVFARQGRFPESASASRLALRAKHEAGDIVGTAFVLEQFSLIAVATGRNTRATWLIGAARPLWERAGALLFGIEPLVSIHEHFLGQLRNELGERRFGTLTERGERCPLPTAIELTITDADEPPALPAGGTWGSGKLTEREEEVAELVSSGLSHREIAERLTISKRTVDAHVEHIYAKLGLSSRSGLAVWLRER